MARKSSKPKAEQENEIVETGGYLYDVEICMIQPRLYALVHTCQTRFKNKLKDDALTKYVADSNDENGLTTLAYKYIEVTENVVSNTI